MQVGSVFAIALDEETQSRVVFYIDILLKDINISSLRVFH